MFEIRPPKQYSLVCAKWISIQILKLKNNNHRHSLNYYWCIIQTPSCFISYKKCSKRRSHVRPRLERPGQKIKGLTQKGCQEDWQARRPSRDPRGRLPGQSGSRKCRSRISEAFLSVVCEEQQGVYLLPSPKAKTEMFTLSLFLQKRLSISLL